MAEYKEKIRKLLALAESPNENEAKAALLRAHELMAKHKLTEADCTETEMRKVRRVTTQFNLHERGGYGKWMLDLANTVAKQYCCEALLVRDSLFTRPCFIGLDNDVDVCVEVYSYALRAIDTKFHHLRCSENVRTYKLPSYLIRKFNDYGYGFADGLNEAFMRQNGEHPEWALVMVTPTEVKKASDNLCTGHIAHSPKPCGKSYSDGFNDGKEFRPNKSLKGEMPHELNAFRR